MFAPRTVVKRFGDGDGEGKQMPVYSLHLPSAQDVATSSAVWRENVTAPPPFFDRVTQATLEAIELMTSMTNSRVDMAQAPVEVSGLLELKGEKDRLFLMGLSVDCAVKLTRSVLGDVPVEVDEELVSDCVGELCNIIVGRMRERIEPDEAFEMTVPIVVFSDSPRIHWQAEADVYEAHFHGEAGPFTIRLLNRR